MRSMTRLRWVDFCKGLPQSGYKPVKAYLFAQHFTWCLLSGGVTSLSLEPPSYRGACIAGRHLKQLQCIPTCLPVRVCTEKSLTIAKPWSTNNYLTSGRLRYSCAHDHAQQHHESLTTASERGGMWAGAASPHLQAVLCEAVSTDS